MHIVKIDGSRKHHLMTSMVSDRTVCGRDFISVELVTLDDYPFDFCQKCWIFIGKEMVGDFLGLDFWERLNEEYQSSVTTRKVSDKR